MAFTDIKGREGFNVDSMFDGLATATKNVQAQMDLLKKAGSTISISDMFQMQMLMNKLSQLSEMSSSVISASNSAIASMARNVKS
jgi:hypothetical protein